MSLRFLSRLVARIFLYTFLVVCLLAAAGLLLLDRTFKSDQLKPDIEAELTDFFQRPVQIQKLRWSIGPALVLSAADVIIFEHNGVVISASPEVQLTIDVWSLLKKEIQIKGITVEKPSLILRRKGDGSNNLMALIADIQQARKKKLKQSNSARLKTVIDVVELDNASVKYIDEAIGPKPLPARLVGDAIFDITTSSISVLFKWDAALITDAKEKGRLSGQGELGPVIWMKLSSQQMPIQFFTPYAAWAGRLHGRISGDVTYSERRQQSAWEGSVKSDEVTIGTHTVPLQLQSNFMVVLGSQTMVQLFLTGEKTNLSAQLQTSPRETKLLSAVVHSTTTQMEEVLGWWQAFRPSGGTRFETAAATPPVAGSPTPAWRTEVSLKINQLRYQGDELNQLSAFVIYEDPTVIVDRFTVMVGTGVLTGWFKTDLSSPFPYQMLWSGLDFDVGVLGPRIGVTIFETGRLTSNGRLSGMFGDGNLDKLNGTFNLRISEGALAEVPGVLKVMEKLNLRSTFKKSAESNRDILPFDALESSVTVTQGVLQTAAPLILQNQMMKMTFEGSINMEEDSINGTSLLYFQTFMTEVVKAVPGVRTILIGKTKSMSPLVVTIKGPRKNPKFTIQAAKGVGKTVTNIFKNVFSLPADVVNSLSKEEEAPPKKEPVSWEPDEVEPPGLDQPTP